MGKGKRCPSCKYYAEEYAPYVHATIPVCNYRGEYRCAYVRNDVDYNTRGRKGNEQTD